MATKSNPPDKKKIRPKTTAKLGKIKKQIGICLKNHRLKKGLNRTEVAGLIGNVTTQWLCIVEHGNGMLSAQRLDKLSRAIEIPPDEKQRLNDLYMDYQITKTQERLGL